MEKDEAPFAEDAGWNDTDLFAADFIPATNSVPRSCTLVTRGDYW